MDLLRHGGMNWFFGGIRAPSTLGKFRQLDAVAATVLAGLAERSPLLGGAAAVTFVDVDDTVKQTYGYAKQGAGYGYSGVKGLNALLATVSTPSNAPVIVATQAAEGIGELGAGGGPAGRRRGAHRPAGRGRWTGRRARRLRLLQPSGGGRCPTGRRPLLRHRGDDPRRGQRHRRDRRNGVDTDPLSERVWDDEEPRWISDAEVAEVPFTAFTNRRKDEHVTARLIVRRVRRLRLRLRFRGRLASRVRNSAWM